MKVLLKKIQKLDIDVEDFGEDCKRFMRKEFSNSLRVCGMEFVDYSEENKAFFDIETTSTDDIDCTERAIATLSFPRRVVLKGHAFVPES